MMKNVFAVVVAFLICSISWQARSADISTSIVGTWRVTSFSSVTLQTSEVSRPFGEHPIGYLQYSPGGHIVVFLSAGEISKATPPYSDADRAAIHSGIFGAYAGTYSVQGNKVTHHVIASWRPEWVGGDQTRFVELDGNNKMTIKTAPLVSGLTGKQNVSTLTFEREE
jgi:Lipocalin-like domain